MTDDNPKLYDLSRRKMLAGLGAVGLASVGAGLGTSAFFSDTESFSDNSLTAGTLDMSVTANLVAANEYWVNEGGLDLSVVADSEDAVMGLQIDDIKPGDWGIICFEIEVGDNPGYVQVCTENFAEAGGANPEPEQDAEGDADNDADLGEFLLTTVWQEYNGATDGTGMKSDLNVLDPVFNNNSDIIPLAYGEPDLDGVVDADQHHTTAREANDILDVANGGYMIKDDAGELAVVGDADNDADVYEFCLLLELPYEVGNVVQGDSVAFDLVFKTEQVRNNDTPFANNVSGNQTNGTSP
ncbi:SipW-dependent-type signal peptide-containing protein [Halorientalis marina]|uniref:SipW-dependent-type signal peptide-containing protein n=1 Tax=Halorientalis marina TaxID=2931976 RepID=UPI001FF46412|nr:SipW-dependent-type signal peptide-containing protein [Halorientalis marina]